MMYRARYHHLLGPIGLLLMVLYPLAAAAEPSAPAVAVAAVEGPKGAVLRAHLSKVLSRSHTVVKAASSATVLVSGKTSRVRRQWVLDVTVQTATGTPEAVGSAQFKGRNVAMLKKNITRGLVKALGGDINDAHARTLDSRDEAAAPVPVAAAPVASSTNVAAAEAPTTVSAEAESVASEVEALAVVVGAQMFTRSLSYTDDIYQDLYGYNLPLGPALVADAQWFPGAHKWGSDHVLSHVGLRARGHAAVGLNSDGPTTHDTSAWGAELNLRGRLPLWGHTLGLEAGYGTDRFTFADSDEGDDAPTPDTVYRFWRVGVDGRLNLGTWSVGLGWAWRFVTDSGEIASSAWFPRSDVNAVEARLALGYALSDQLEVGLGLDWRRYAFTLNPEEGDTLVAGGALDQTLTGGLQLGWRL